MATHEVGSKSPVVKGPLSETTMPAVSVKFSVAGPLWPKPPAPARSMYFVPLGPTSNMSRLSGCRTERSNSVTRIEPITAGAPETLIVDGYGNEAVPPVIETFSILRNAEAVSRIAKTADDRPRVPNIGFERRRFIVSPLSLRLSPQVVT